MEDLLVRPAAASDAKEILDIYAYYVENTPVTFEEVTPTILEFTGRTDKIISAYPYFVCIRNDKVIGYAYAHKYRERSAYRYDVEVSVYLRNGCNGQGAGTALYHKLFEALAQQDYYNAYAVITLPNDNSIALHEKFGFTKIGVHRKTGYKLGEWHDVLWMEKVLKDHSEIDAG